MGANHEDIGLRPRVCKQCGKHFESRSEYAYKIRRTNRTDLFHYFCSWKCLRVYEKENSSRRKQTQQQKIAYQLGLDEKEDIYESAV